MNKLVSLIFFISLLLTTNLGISQVNNNTYQLDAKDMSLVEILSEIEQKHKVAFRYNIEWLNKSYQQENFKYSSLDELLDQLFANTQITYLKRKPNYYILLKNNPQKIDYDFKKNEDKPTRIELGTVTFQSSEVWLSGQVISGDDLSPVTAATVNVDDQFNTTTNVQGKYNIKLLPGLHKIKVNSIEAQPITLEVQLNSSAELNFTLYRDFKQLEDVVVTAQREDANVEETIAGKETINIKELEKIPAFLGEPDVIRSITSLPGVNTSSETSSGFNSRGIGAGNNLILADGGIIFNPSHMLGIVTSFNSGAVSSAEFYKGAIPANYGGRMGSVLDVNFKTASKEIFSVNGGVGILSSNLNMQLPVIKKQSSLQMGFRMAYPNYLRTLIPIEDLRNSAATFADGQMKYVHDINEDNQIEFSTYSSTDDITFAGELRYDYSQLLSTIRWRHNFSKNLFLNTFYNYSTYRAQLRTLNSENANDEILKTAVEVNRINMDFTWDKFPSHQIQWGLNNNYYWMNPRQFTNSDQKTTSLKTESVLESAFYLSDIYQFSDRLNLYAGLRFTAYLPQFEELSKNYLAIDPRASLNYKLNAKTSLKFSYNRATQFLHLISNTTSISPVNMRKFSNTLIKPSVSNQFSIGIFKNFNSNTIETSIEFYKGWVNNALDFKDGANLTSSESIESELLQGHADNYGVEFYLKKNSGRLNGWISYTYSRSILTIDGKDKENSINKGEPYPSYFDQPHVLNIMTNYQFNRRVDFSFNFVYNTGRPLTLPIGVYTVYGKSVTEYSGRNNLRIPDYHRLDFSIHFAPPLKKYKKIRGSWTFTLYNIYARKNAYSVYYRPSELQNSLEGYKLSIIGNIVPSLTYNFKF